MEQFRARKGLDAYSQFVSGWVKEIKTWRVLDKYLTVGRVSGIKLLAFSSLFLVISVSVWLMCSLRI